MTAENEIQKKDLELLNDHQKSDQQPKKEEPKPEVRQNDLETN